MNAVEYDEENLKYNFFLNKFRNYNLLITYSDDDNNLKTSNPNSRIHKTINQNMIRKPNTGMELYRQHPQLE